MLSVEQREIVHKVNDTIQLLANLSQSEAFDVFVVYFVDIVDYF